VHALKARFDGDFADVRWRGTKSKLRDAQQTLLPRPTPNHYIALMSGDGLFNNLSEETIVKANPLNYPLASPSHE
jgi:hypothetical protein